MRLVQAVSVSLLLSSVYADIYRWGCIGMAVAGTWTPIWWNIVAKSSGNATLQTHSKHIVSRDREYEARACVGSFMTYFQLRYKP